MRDKGAPRAITGQKLNAELLRVQAQTNALDDLYPAIVQLAQFKRKTAKGLESRINQEVQKKRARR